MALPRIGCAIRAGAKQRTFNAMDDNERHETACCEANVPLPTLLWCLGTSSGVFLFLHDVHAQFLSFLQPSFYSHRVELQHPVPDAHAILAVKRQDHRLDWRTEA